MAAHRPSLTDLTRREWEVVELAARGLTNRQIAARLYISIRTVNAHLSHAYAKLGTSRREDLVAFVPRGRMELSAVTPAVPPASPRGFVGMLVAFSITPLGVGEAVGRQVADSLRVVRDSGLPNRTNAMFTTVEGDWDEVMAVVKQAIDAVNAPRVSLTLKALSVRVR